MTEPGARWDAAAGVCRFALWAPRAGRVDLELIEPVTGGVAMTRDADGFHHARVEGAGPGTLYRFRVDGERLRPDPASRLQPRGVHGPSQVVDPAFPWSDRAAAFRPPPLADWVLYELHVAAFSAAGTFDGVIPHLDRLRDLGVTAVQLMPFAQFPGERNWGYDGVLPHAVQASYGGPAALQRLVDACHRRGLAVIADVVYNHLGPEGNYLAELGPYFTDRHRTPWGPAINFDGPDSEPVRDYFLAAARMLVTDYRIDALRVDAIHAIVDTSARPFLQELCDEVRRAAAAAGREARLLAESDLNDARVVMPADRGGLGFDGQYADDFHHAVHALVTGERGGYYADFGGLDQLAEALSQPFLYRGQRSAYRRRRHGNDPGRLGGDRFVVCTQNHDQVGNRAAGDRLTPALPFELHKTLACLLLLAPYVPMLFMGQEYGETAPFLYFTDHGDPALGAAVAAGRRRDLAGLGWPADAVADPQAASSFERSRLDWSLVERPEHRALWELHRALLALRRSSPALAGADRFHTEAVALPGAPALVLRRGRGGELVAVLSLAAEPVDVTVTLAAGDWRTAIDTASARWQGPGAAAPPHLSSPGSVDLRLPGHATLVFERAG